VAHWVPTGAVLMSYHRVAGTTCMMHVMLELHVRIACATMQRTACAAMLTNSSYSSLRASTLQPLLHVQSELSKHYLDSVLLFHIMSVAHAHNSSQCLFLCAPLSRCGGDHLPFWARPL
jgi:hypothetical protein